MKRMLALALALLLALAVPGFAETGQYWTDGAEWYFHGAQNCGGVEGRAPVSLEDAAKLPREPCPLCLSRDGGREIRAVRKVGANLLLIQIPDALLAKLAAGAEFAPASGGERRFEGEEAWREAGVCLNGAALLRFLAELRADGSAEAVALAPEMIDAGAGSGLRELLSARHLGGAWRLLYRVEPVAEPLRLRAVVGSYRLRMEGDALHRAPQGRATLDLGELRPLERSVDPLLEMEREGFRLRVLRMRGGYLAQVLRDGEEAAGSAELCIEGGAPILLSRFAPGEPAFCACALTRSEVRALMNGADVELRPADRS